MSEAEGTSDAAPEATVPAIDAITYDMSELMLKDE
jgi:hypothetical protein